MTVFLSWSDCPPDPRSRRCRLHHDLNPAHRSGQWRVADSPSGGPECCPAAQHQRNDVTSSISAITNSTNTKSLHIEADQANINVLASVASISVDNTAQTQENMEDGGGQEGAGHVLCSRGLRGAAYLSWNWDLQFAFLWSSDRYHCLFLEGLEKPDVLMGHVGPRE